MVGRGSISIVSGRLQAALRSCLAVVLVLLAEFWTVISHLLRVVAIFVARSFGQPIRWGS